jgi:hypothetical protein
MNSKTTYVWGVCADSAGIVRQYSDEIQQLPGGGVRVERRSRLEHEPASSYSSVHPWPMPMNYRHEQTIGSIVALRRAHGNLYAVGECDLEPDELAALASEQGLRWSTGTNTQYGSPLRITEISLVPEAATIGMPPVSWYKLDVTKGNPPDWVRAEIDRADSKIERRSRRGGELLVHEVGETAIDIAGSTLSEYDRLGMELGLLPGGYEHRIDSGDYGELEYSVHPGRILSVGGRPLR